MTAKTFKIVKPIVYVLIVGFCFFFWLFVIKAVL
jgi:hypothetical protein